MDVGFGNVNLGGGIGQLLNVSDLSSLFGLLITLFFNIGLAVGLIFVIVSGIKFAVSAGDPQKFEEARGTLINAIIGFIILISFIVIVNLVLNILGYAPIQEQLNP